MIEELLLRSAARTTAGAVDLEPGRATTFDSPAGIDFEVSNPLTKAAFAVLGERYPTAVPFAKLCAAAENRLRDAGVSVDLLENARRELAADLLRCVFAGSAELRSWAPRVSVTVSERPRACRLAAFQLALGRRAVTNVFHETINLEPAQAELLPLLDGSRHRDTLVDASETLQSLANSALLEP